MHKISRKYTKPTYSKKNHGETQGTPNPKWKDDVENGIRKIGIVNWIEVAQDRDGWRRATGRRLSFLEGGATKDKEEVGRANINPRITVLARSKYFNGTLHLSQVYHRVFYTFL